MTQTPVLVLGAGGFVGRHVLAGLHASDWAAPVAATRSGDLPQGAPPVPSVRLDLRDSGALRASLERVEGVVDCTAGGPAAMRAGAASLRAALQAMEHPPRLVYLSSMAVYGDAEGLVGEDTALDTSAGADSYGGAKVLAEGLLRDLPQTVVLRPGCIYGPDSPQWSLRIARLLRSHRIGDLGEGGDGCCNAVFVGDVVQAVLAALRTPGAAGRAFNLSLPEPPTWNGYLLDFARALGAVPVHRIGARRLKIETRLLAPALKIAEIAAGKAGLRSITVPPPIPPSLARLWRQEIRLDVTRAEQGLEIVWTPLAEGLRRTSSHMRA